jgi:hypothetical protein
MTARDAEQGYRRFKLLSDHHHSLACFYGYLDIKLITKDGRYTALLLTWTASSKCYNFNR